MVERNDAMRRRLENIGFNTLLLNPPPEPSFDEIPPMSLPQLKAYLRTQGYKDLKVIDVRFEVGSQRRMRLSNTITKNILNLNLTAISNSARAVNEYQKVLASYVRSLIRPKATWQKYPWSLKDLIESAFTTELEHEIDSFIKQALRKYNPKLIGFSVCYPGQLFYSLMMSRRIRLYDKNVFIVFGGPQISKHIKYLITVKRLVQVVDGLVVGDGEVPLRDLIYQINQDKRFSEVPNLFYRDKSVYKKSIHSFSISTEHILTPDFDDFDSAILPVRASVGCSWGRCSFCTYRRKSTDYYCADERRVVTILNSLYKRYGVRNFRFVDDMLSSAFLNELSKFLLKERLKFFWQCDIALMSDFTKVVVENMALAGCKQVCVGLESMSPRVLRLMNKPHSPEQARKVLRLFKKTGINVCLLIMWGFPSETLSEAKITLDFLRSNQDLYQSLGIQKFCLEEGTEIYKKPERFGIKAIKADKNQGIRLGHSYVKGSGMSSEDVKLFLNQAVKVLAQKG